MWACLPHPVVTAHQPPSLPDRHSFPLTPGVDLVQERFMGGGQQSNETAAEQAKDEVMSDMIRDKYKGMTGSDFPIADKQQSYGGMGGGQQQQQQ